MSNELFLQLCQWGMYAFQTITYTYINMLLLNSKWKHKVSGFFVQQITLLALSFGIRKFLGLEKHTVLLVLSSWLLLYLMITWFYHEPVKKRILFSFIEICLALIVELFTAILTITTAAFRGDLMVYGYESLYSSMEYVALCSVYSSLILFIVSMLFVVCWKVCIEHIWIKEYVLYIMIPFYQSLILYFYYKGCSKLEIRELSTGYILVFFSLLIDIGMNYLINGMIQKLEIEKELETLYVQRETEKQYYEIADQNLKEMEEIKRHMREQLKEAQALITEEEQEKVREILDISYEELKQKGTRRYCENSIVNAIFTIKITAMESEGIETEYQCSIPEQIGIELIDLCSLFTNLLDNAREACEKVKGQLPWVKVRAGVRGGYLTIKVENTCNEISEGQNDQMLTSKQDKVNHGFGLKLVRQIIDKYEGTMQMLIKDHTFQIVATIRMN
ncbi:MAG: GHKL domain-containing protein [Lachnospiraceae bacterium]|nr:GHKL domain-containing protein [Lachnospiraceae bacterium]